MAKAPKLVNLAIEETSGVDHPAHLHEGWLVVKASNPDEVSEIVASLAPQTIEEDSVPEDTTAAAEVTTDETVIAEPLADQTVEADTDDTVEVIVPDTIEALTAELAAARAEIDALKGDVAEEDEALALVKSAPEAVRKAFDAMREQAEAAMQKAAAVEETLVKEREARADEAAIVKAREQFAHLSVDPTVLGPALRKMALLDPDLAAVIEGALSAADAQSESGAIFAEIGKASTPSSGSAFDRLASMAKAAVADGTAPTVEQAMASLATTQPDLYTDYLTEKGA